MQKMRLKGNDGSWNRSLNHHIGNMSPGRVCYLIGKVQGEVIE